MSALGQKRTLLATEYTADYVSNVLKILIVDHTSIIGYNLRFLQLNIIFFKTRTNPSIYGYIAA